MNKRRIFINIDLFIFDGIVILVQVKSLVVVVVIAAFVIVHTIVSSIHSTIMDEI